MPGPRPVSLQDAIRRRGETRFVGRTEEVENFRENLRLGLDDPARAFVVHVHGQSGVGKSTFMRELRRYATEDGATTAWSDFSEDTVLEPLADIARQLEDSGISMRPFLKRYNEYRTKRTTLLSDPAAPSGVEALLLTLAVKAGLGSLQSIPVVGDAAEPLGEEATEERVSRALIYVRDTIRGRATQSLLLNPVNELTPLFCQCLSNHDPDQLTIIFIDTFERREKYFGGWLRDVIRGAYGVVPLNIAFVVGGQKRPEARTWSEFESISYETELALFTAEEVRQLLRDYGITSEEVVQSAIRVSGRLPVLVGMIGQNAPRAPGEDFDPSEDAVEWFLRQESDSKRRQQVLSASIPRRLDSSVVRQIVGDGEGDEVLEMLREHPFTTSNLGTLRYHEVVRRAMLTFQRTRSKSEYEKNHVELANLYSSRWNERTSTNEETLRDRDDMFYHGLCGRAETFPIGVFYTHTARCLSRGEAALSRWHQTVAEAYRDSASERLKALVEKVERCVNGGHAEAVDFYSEALDVVDDYKLQRVLLRDRARRLRRAERDEESLRDFKKLHEDEPEDLSSAISYAYGLVILDRPNEGIHVLDGFSPKEDEETRLLLEKATILNHADRHGEALLLADEAIDRGADRRALVQRVKALTELKRLDEALAIVLKLVEEEPTQGEYLRHLAIVRERRGEYSDALAAINLEMASDPSNKWAVQRKANILRNLGEYQEAVDFYRQGLTSTSSRYQGGLFDSAETLRFQARYREAQQEYRESLRRSGPLAKDRAFVQVRIAEMDRLLGDPRRCSTALNSVRASNDVEEMWLDYTVFLARVQAGDAQGSNEAVAKLIASLDAGNDRPDRDSPQWCFNSALALSACGRETEANAKFEEFLAKTSEPFVFTMARLLLEESVDTLGLENGALSDLIALLDLADQPD